MMTAVRTRGRRIASLFMLVLAAVLVVGLGSATAATPRAQQSPAPIDEDLAAQMERDPAGTFSVLVHGEDLESANAAVRATGMTKKGEFRKIGVVRAEATAPQIQDARTEPGITYLEAHKPYRTYSTQSSS